MLQQLFRPDTYQCLLCKIYFALFCLSGTSPYHWLGHISEVAFSARALYLLLLTSSQVPLLSSIFLIVPIPAQKRLSVRQH